MEMIITSPAKGTGSMLSEGMSSFGLDLLDGNDGND